MRITLDPAKVRQTTRNEWLVRFAFGGLVTVLAGIIGTAYGPEVGGLFLAFPSISSASLTLIQRQDGKNAAGIDALGAVLGSIGLIGFGAIVWALAARAPGWLTLVLASVVWLLIGCGLWSGSLWVRRHRARRSTG